MAAMVRRQGVRTAARALCVAVFGRAASITAAPSLADLIYARSIRRSAGLPDNLWARRTERAPLGNICTLGFVWCARVPATY